MSLFILLRLAGASLVVLSLFHAVLWRKLDWGREMDRLTPLNARVFAVHTFFIAFVLCALGASSRSGRSIESAPSDLARLVLYAVVLFWIARLLIQPLVFDRVMVTGLTRSLWVRVGASLLWMVYVGIYAAALWRQFEAPGAH